MKKINSAKRRKEKKTTTIILAKTKDVIADLRDDPGASWFDDCWRSDGR